MGDTFLTRMCKGENTMVLDKKEEKSQLHSLFVQMDFGQKCILENSN